MQKMHNIYRSKQEGRDQAEHPYLGAQGQGLHLRHQVESDRQGSALQTQSQGGATCAQKRSYISCEYAEYAKYATYAEYAEFSEYAKYVEYVEIGKYEKYTEYAECAQYGKIYANYAKYAVYADLIKQPTPGSVMPMAMFFPSFGQYLHLNRSLAICFFKFDTGFEHILLLLAYTDMPDTPLTLHTPLPPRHVSGKEKEIEK